MEDKNAIKTSRAVYERYQFETPDDDEEDDEGQNADVSDVAYEVKPFETKPFNVYDDEYDDTYDGHNVNVDDDTVPDEVVATYYQRSRSNIETEESEDVRLGNFRSLNNFHSNVYIIFDSRLPHRQQIIEPKEKREMAVALIEEHIRAEETGRIKKGTKDVMLIIIGRMELFTNIRKVLDFTKFIIIYCYLFLFLVL